MAETRTRKRRATGAGARVGGDHIALHVIAVVGTIAMAGASWTISFTSLLAVAVWQSYPAQIHFMTAIEIDAPIVVFNVATIIFKTREQFGAEHAARAVAVVMTGVSSGANFLHTVNVDGLGGYQQWIGASFNALAPILVFVCAEILGLLITRPRTKNSPVARARAAADKARAELRELKKAQREPRSVGIVPLPTLPAVSKTTAGVAAATPTPAVLPSGSVQLSGLVAGE